MRFVSGEDEDIVVKWGGGGGGLGEFFDRCFWNMGFGLYELSDLLVGFWFFDIGDGLVFGW